MELPHVLNVVDEVEVADGSIQPVKVDRDQHLPTQT
jgi:hypothetical protein